VQRVLDIDLDFFVTPVVHWPQWQDRAPADHEVWPVEEAVGFLTERCLLTARLPGFVTERHDELFWLWRDAIRDGALVPPFDVVHLDAHADLGLGDAGYAYLMTELLFEPAELREEPRAETEGSSGLAEGNFLLFALACGWIGSMRYVYGDGGGDDEPLYAREGFDVDATRLQLAAMSQHELDRFLRREVPVVSRLEPAVPYVSGHHREFEAAEAFDFVCITRSPRYTPAAADVLFDVLVDTFVDPTECRRPG
jgi:hypothetical protein